MVIISLSFGITSAQVVDYQSNDLINTISIAQDNYQFVEANENKYVRIIYLVPADSIEKPEYTMALENAARHLQAWFYDSLGLDKTFLLSDPIVEVFQTPHESSWYSTNPNGIRYWGFWNNILQDGFPPTGGMVNDPNNRWVFYIDANPGCDQCGGCGGNGIVVISANDLKGLVGYEIDKSCPNVVKTFESCRYVGGMGHELGHALGIMHPPECDEDSPLCWDEDIMGFGYTTYPVAYFNESDKEKLNNSPFIQYIDIEDLDYTVDCMELTDTCLFNPISEASIIYGDSIFLEGRYQRTTGIYYDTLYSDVFCDSIIITFLTVEIPPANAEDVSICEGEEPVLSADGENINWYMKCPVPMTDLYDGRDGQSYKAVAIGSQIWMAENLNYYTSNGSWYYGNDSVSFSETYGRLYNWQTAQQVCPADWYLPDEDDWLDLINYLGGTELAGGRIKESGNEHWDLPNKGATNASGFTALPAGKKDFGGGYHHLGYYSKFWSASKVNTDWGKAFEVNSNSGEIFAGTVSKETAFSIRCVRDNNLLIGTGNNLIPGNSSPGIHTFFVTQTILGEESPCDTVILTIGEIPTEPAILDTLICEGDSLNVGGNYYSSTGTYYDTLQSIHGCDSIIITELTAHYLPIIDLGNDTTISTNDTIVLYAGDGFADYFWSNGSNTQTLTLHNLNVGDYEFSVIVIDSNRCSNSDTIQIHVVSPTTGLTKEKFDNILIEVYPNPTRQYLFIEAISNTEAKLTFEFVDVFGNIVFERKTEATDTTDPIGFNIQNLKPGIYILRIRSRDFSWIKKIIKSE